VGTTTVPLHRSRRYLTLTVNVVREANAACLTSPGARAAATCWACPGLRLSFGDLARGTGPVDRGTHSHEVLGLPTEEHIDRTVRSLAPRLQVIVMARSLAAMLPWLGQESVKSVGREGVIWPAFLASGADGSVKARAASASRVVGDEATVIPVRFGLRVLLLLAQGRPPEPQGLGAKRQAWLKERSDRSLADLVAPGLARVG
jgi:hypothetical protein